MVQLRETPLDSSIVAGIGGLIIMVIGAYGLIVTFGVADRSPMDLLEVTLGTIWGAIIIAASILLFLNSNRHVLWSIIIIIFSLASWYGTSGGFLVGFSMAFIGGLMGYSWKEPRMNVEGVKNETYPNDERSRKDA